MSQDVWVKPLQDPIPSFAERHCLKQALGASMLCGEPVYGKVRCSYITGIIVKYSCGRKLPIDMHNILGRSSGYDM